MTDLEITLCEEILRIQNKLENALMVSTPAGTITVLQTVGYAALIARRAIASDKFKSGVKPDFSTGICGSTTAGYGHLDQNGYFQFPLQVNQETYVASSWK